MNARVFVGEDVCRDQLWLHTSADFSTCVFLASSYLKIVPGFLRPLAALFNPYVRRIRHHRHNARQILVPEIMRRRAKAEGGEKETGHVSQPQDMLQWLEDFSTGEDLAPERIVDRQLGLSFASTHGTTNLIVNVIYDLAARWDEYAQELRNELESALDEDGGVISKTTPSKLSKMDSFIKESQRMNPGSARKLPKNTENIKLDGKLKLLVLQSHSIASS